MSKIIRKKYRDIENRERINEKKMERTKEKERKR